MKNGFKDPVGVKERKEGKSPWNFEAPTYDRRSSRNITAGTDYGSGHKQPVGHEDNPSSEAACLPLKSRMFKSDL